MNNVQQAIRDAAEKGGYRYRWWKANDLEQSEGYNGLQLRALSEQLQDRHLLDRCITLRCVWPRGRLVRRPLGCLSRNLCQLRPLEVQILGGLPQTDDRINGSDASNLRAHHRSHCDGRWSTNDRTGGRHDADGLSGHRDRRNRRCEARACFHGHHRQLHEQDGPWLRRPYLWGATDPLA